MANAIQAAQYRHWIPHKICIGYGFATRRGLEYRRNGDLKALGAAAFQRWGTDITIMAESRELRLLSVHLRTGCWGEKQDGESRSRKACATLRGQMERLKAWPDARRAAGMPFVFLGDFNRRLTLSGDWAWRVLSPASAPLRLLPAGEPFRFDPRFPAFIDHMVAEGGAEAMVVPGTFRDAPQRGPHPDHCAISAVFQLVD